MADTALASHLADERSRAIRVLLGRPLLDVDAEPDEFRLVIRHHGWLVEWFDTACGWHLAVDPAAGFARLAKRPAYGSVDVTRPLKRTRGGEAPFDRRRYQLLCLSCTELVRHPVTTIGLLAGAVTAEAGLDTSRHGERAAFVDALRALIAWGALRTTAGDVDAYLDSDQANALLTADTVRLHRLLASAIAPSAVDDHLDTDSATVAMLAEPRYGDAAVDPAATDEDQRLRWVRHTLGRRMLDDPAVHADELTDAERDYLANPSGRRWLRDRAAEAGFDLEERSDGVLAVDTDGIATDRLFPAPLGNAHQLALLLIDQLVVPVAGGERTLVTLTAVDVRREVQAVLDRFPGWARAHREGDGPARLADEAIDVLAAFGLARRGPDGSVVARPAAARYRVGEPTTRGEPSLFEEEL